MASSAGFEPTAFRLGGERSILLSYEDIYLCYYNKYAIFCQTKTVRKLIRTVFLFLLRWHFCNTFYTVIYGNFLFKQHIVVFGSPLVAVMALLVKLFFTYFYIDFSKSL